MGLIELLIAMGVTSISIMALVAGFSSGNVALERANNAASAASVADAEMENYRALRYDAITISPGCLAPACPPTLATTPTAGNGRTYNMEVTLGWMCPVGTLGAPIPPATEPRCSSPTSHPTKVVRIVVKNQAGTKTLYSQSTTFAKKITG
jgi:type II secretory pathway pseudopilin PulG